MPSVSDKHSVIPVLLLILDGVGCRDAAPDNPVSLARKPNWDRLWREFAHTTIDASERSVGLPSGQMGNSEVGHLNIGAGRVIYQDFTRIDRAIETGEFATNPVLAEAVATARRNNATFHVLGLVSPGGVHSHERQIAAMVESLAQRLKQRPDDADGWVLLAHSYQALERFAEATDAYAHADALIPNNASLLADYADALAMAQGRRLEGAPAALIQRALAIDPKQKKALALAATVALETRDLLGSGAHGRVAEAGVPVLVQPARLDHVVVADVVEMEDCHLVDRGTTAGVRETCRRARSLAVSRSLIG